MKMTNDITKAQYGELSERGESIRQRLIDAKLDHFVFAVESWQKDTGALVVPISVLYDTPELVRSMVTFAALHRVPLLISPFSDDATAYAVLSR